MAKLARSFVALLRPSGCRFRSTATSETLQQRSDLSVKWQNQHLMLQIHDSLNVAAPGEDTKTLRDMSHYYFDGQGKGIRPQITMVMADAANCHMGVETDQDLFERQKQVAQVAEMFHTASLLHDDVIDKAETRRGKVSVNQKWGQRNSIMAGDFIVAIANKIISELEDIQVVDVMTRILNDLVIGELQQMSKTKEDKEDRFQCYIDKTFNKTASLMAASCKAVALLATDAGQTNASHIQFVKQYQSFDKNPLAEAAYLYGKNIGIAFQLIDDWLDFAASAEQLGKPAAADLRLGLATAPVLFAAEQYPELNGLIKRRFSEQGDVESAFKLVLESDGMSQTKMLARKYCKHARHNVQNWNESPAKQSLIQLVDKVVNRMT